MYAIIGGTVAVICIIAIYQFFKWDERKRLDAEFKKHRQFKYYDGLEK